MVLKHINKIVLYVMILSTAVIMAQEPKDTLNTEIIEVVKPYVPSIQDAFKIKENPQQDTQVVPRETVSYQINSVPVASTFMPEKGTAKNLKTSGNHNYYNNYISFGFGNYTSPLLDAFVSLSQDEYSSFGVKLYHHSSQGGIKDVDLKNSYYNTKVGAFYQRQSNFSDFNLGVNVKHDYYNWYGLNPEINLDENYLNSINPAHAYLGIQATGTLKKVDTSVFKGGLVQLGYFKDDFKSNEKRLLMQPTFEFPISTEHLEVKADLDYLNGVHSYDIDGISDLTYGFIKFGLLPNFKMSKDALTFNLGLKGYLLHNQSNDETVFSAFPNVDISYHISPGTMTIYSGVTGGLTLNSYDEHSEHNPFLITEFYSETTKENYKIYAGLKGRLEQARFNLKAFYSDLNNLAMYSIHPNQGFMPAGVPGYNSTFINAFGMTYDHTKVLGVNASIDVPFNEQLTFGGLLEYNHYTLDKELEPWNLPALEANIYTNYAYDQWEAQAKLLFRSQTYDTKIRPLMTNNLVPIDPDITLQRSYIVENKAFADLNLSVSYHINEQLSVFAQGHNLLSNNYEKYYSYPHQGIQLLGGLTYRFD